MHPLPSLQIETHWPATEKATAFICTLATQTRLQVATACCLLDQGANSQTRSKTVISCTNISDKYYLADTFPVIVERVSRKMETPVV